MTDCFVYGGRSPATPIVLVNSSNYSRAVKKLTKPQIRWLEENEFSGKQGSFCAIPDKSGGVEKYIAGASEQIWKHSLQAGGSGHMSLTVIRKMV